MSIKIFYLFSSSILDGKMQGIKLKSSPELDCWGFKKNHWVVDNHLWFLTKHRPSNSLPQNPKKGFRGPSWRVVNRIFRNDLDCGWVLMDLLLQGWMTLQPLWKMTPQFTWHNVVFFLVFGGRIDTGFYPSFVDVRYPSQPHLASGKSPITKESFWKIMLATLTWMILRLLQSFF